MLLGPGKNTSSDTDSAEPWLVIVGPTGVGKSAVADILSKHLSTDVLTADSRQVYQKMDIGTGKPASGSAGHPKRPLIDLVAPDEPFSVGHYQRLARKQISKLESEGKTILIEGGTGLYVKALLYGLWQGPSPDPAYRAVLRAKETEDGSGTLHQLLEKVDPISSRTIHANNVARIIRALEVHYLTGKPLSESHAEDQKEKANRTTPHLIIGLRRDREDLYQRINARVDGMIAEGFVAEVAELLSQGYSPKLQSMLALGYRQLVPHLCEGEDLATAIALMKQETRRFAKRQLSWFRADPNIRWIDLSVGDSAEACADTIMRLKKNRSVI